MGKCTGETRAAVCLPSLPPQNSADPQRLGEPVGASALHRGHASTGLKSTLDDPLSQPLVGGRTVSQRGLVLGVEAAVITDRAPIADERVVDEVGNACL